MFNDKTTLYKYGIMSGALFVMILSFITICVAVYGFIYGIYIITNYNIVNTIVATIGLFVFIGYTSRNDARKVIDKMHQIQQHRIKNKQ